MQAAVESARWHRSVNQSMQQKHERAGDHLSSRRLEIHRCHRAGQSDHSGRQAVVQQVSSTRPNPQQRFRRGWIGAKLTKERHRNTRNSQLRPGSPVSLRIHQAGHLSSGTTGLFPPCHPVERPPEADDSYRYGRSNLCHSGRTSIAELQQTRSRHEES